MMRPPFSTLTGAPTQRRAASPTSRCAGGNRHPDWGAKPPLPGRRICFPSARLCPACMFHDAVVTNVCRTRSPQRSGRRRPQSATSPPRLSASGPRWERPWAVPSSMAQHTRPAGSPSTTVSLDRPDAVFCVRMQGQNEELTAGQAATLARNERTIDILKEEVSLRNSCMISMILSSLSEFDHLCTLQLASISWGSRPSNHDKHAASCGTVCRTEACLKIHTD